jgi:hypothetical protein
VTSPFVKNPPYQLWFTLHHYGAPKPHSSRHHDTVPASLCMDHTPMHAPLAPHNAVPHRAFDNTQRPRAERSRQSSTHLHHFARSHHDSSQHPVSSSIRRHATNTIAYEKFSPQEAQSLPYGRRVRTRLARQHRADSTLELLVRRGQREEANEEETQ